MTKRGRVVFGGLIVALFMSFVAADLVAARAPKPTKKVQEDRAMDFTLYDLQGRRFTLSENLGKPVLMIFGATWCVYCRDEIPRLKEIHAKYTKRGLVMVNVDIKESRDKVAQFAEANKLPYRIVLDEKGEVARNYGVLGVPTKALVDGKGLVVCRNCDDVESLVENLLKKK